MARDRKPTIFVASSVEGLGIAYAVQQNLRDDAEVTVWKQGVFHLTTTDAGIVGVGSGELRLRDFCIFAGRSVQIRGQESPSVRDNVVFELGLFIGHLGKTRCFILCPESRDFRIPTDLIGITPATYETDRSDGSDQAACGPACHDIRLAIKKLGSISKESQTTEGAPESNAEARRREGKLEPTEESSNAENWVTAFVDKDYTKAEKLVNAELAKSKTDAEKEQNRAHLATIEFGRDAKKGSEYFESLLREHPKSAEIFSWYAYNYFWLQLYDHALVIIDRGLAACENDGSLIGARARILTRLGKSNELAQEKEGWIVGNIGNLLSTRGLYADAIRKFKAALALEPDSQYAHERLAGTMRSKASEVERLSQMLSVSVPVFSLADEKRRRLR